MRKIVIVLTLMMLILTTDSYVNIRENPKKGAAKVGYACCGDDFQTDGKTRNGFLHVFAPIEAGEGWISTGYIVYSHPEEVAETWRVDSNGRVAARYSIGGSRYKWLKNGEDIYVYYVAEVAVTNRGFVDARYLSPKD